MNCRRKLFPRKRSPWTYNCHKSQSQNKQNNVSQLHLIIGKSQTKGNRSRTKNDQSQTLKKQLYAPKADKEFSLHLTCKLTTSQMTNSKRINMKLGTLRGRNPLNISTQNQESAPVKQTKTSTKIKKRRKGLSFSV